MRFIPTAMHGVLDYLMGVLLMAAPWLFGFAAGGAETWTPVVLGAAVIVYSLLTNYELGLWGLFPMTSHLWLDGLAGATLAVSPWLFGFADQVWAPHVVLGVLEIGAALMTKKVPTRPALDSRPRPPAVPRTAGPRATAVQQVQAHRAR